MDEKVKGCTNGSHSYIPFTITMLCQIGYCSHINVLYNFKQKFGNDPFYSFMYQISSLGEDLHADEVQTTNHLMQ